jgi:5-methylcytosine-specific restriction endonuclease McrA
MIPAEELARLAAFYDRFANHLDPLSDDWKRRKHEYFECLQEMHRRFATGLPFEEFRREAQRARKLMPVEKMTYRHKLRDARWQQLRLKVMQRDAWGCQAKDCRSLENTMLHVHHRRYLPGREPWEYPLEDLVTYCETCHKMQHADSNRNGELREGGVLSLG